MARLSEIRLPEPPVGLQMVSESWLMFLLCAELLFRWVPGTWLSPTFFQVGLFLLASIWAVEMIRRPYRIRGSFRLIPIGAAAIWPVLQLATGNTISRWETEQAVLLWSGNFLAVFFGMQLIGASKRRLGLMQVLAVFAFALILISLLGHFSAPDKVLWTWDVSFNDTFGPFISRDRYAAFVELILPLLVALAFQQGQPASLWLGMAAATVACVTGSASRAGAIVTGTEIIVLFAAVQRSARSKRRSRRSLWLVVFAAMTVLFTIVVGIGSLTNRFGDPDPYYGRREMLQSSMEMVPKRPVFGFGIGNFPNAYPPYAKFDSDKLINHAHNDWAEWAVDGGLPFWACMIIATCWLLPKALKSVWGIGLLAVLVHGLVDFPLQDPAIELWFFVLFGGLTASPTP